MDIGTFLLMLGLSYGLGLLWYDLLPGKVPDHIWRVAAYPFLGMFAAHALLPRWFDFFNADVKFGGIGLLMALIGSIVGVVIDWAITQARQPSMVVPELRTAARQPAAA